MFSEADNGVTAVTDAAVSALEHKDIFKLFQDHPHLGVGIFWTAAQEDAVIAEHLVDVGRRTAYERVGHMFLELFLRLQVIGATDGPSFDLPLNQVALADALGLSQVHVNRTLQRLRREGLLDIAGRRATILDQDALERAVEFERTYLHLAGLSPWLRRRFNGGDPPPRRPGQLGTGPTIPFAD
jgi:CRP-like cAMP-binding protein